MVGIAKSTSGADRPVKTPVSGIESGPSAPPADPAKSLFSAVVAGTPRKRLRMEVQDSSPTIPVQMDAAPRPLTEETAEKNTSLSQRPGPLSSKKGPINRTHSRTDIDYLRVDVEEGCRVLVLGDSQVKNLTGLPAGFQIESFRGARYPWITDVVNGLDLPDSVEHIVLAAGINDRDSDVSKTVRPTFVTCMEALRKTRRKIHFLGIDVPRSFTAKQERTINDINEMAFRSVQQEGFIGDSQGRVTTVVDGLHYDTTTLKQIAAKITRHFSFLN
jgi:hypothetical protein